MRDTDIREVAETVDAMAPVVRNMSNRLPSIEGSSLFCELFVQALMSALTTEQPALAAAIKVKIRAIIGVWRRGETGPFDPVAVEVAVEALEELLE